MTYKGLYILTGLMVVILAVFISFAIDGQKKMIALNEKIHELNVVSNNYEMQIADLKSKIEATRTSLQTIKTTVDNIPKEPEVKIASIKKETPPVEKYSKTDLNLLARLIESESGNQPIEGKMAVGTVVMNRVASDEFPDTIRDVIFQKHQFSVVPNGAIRKKPSDESLSVAKKILEGARSLNPGVLYFYNPKISTDKWIKTRKTVERIGDHIFAS